MIEIIDLKQEKQAIVRVMICQLNANEYDWKSSSGLHFIVHNDKISIKVHEFLKIAKHNSVDLLLFPELSIPLKLIEKIQGWSKEQESIVICGSHYHIDHGEYISRCPIIIKGNVYFTEKIHPSPLEKSPIKGEGLKSGIKILKFTNSFIGNFAVLICADYLDDTLKSDLDLNSLDILCVPAYQRDSKVYQRRMNVDCEESSEGIYVLYSNFTCNRYCDGTSSIFGLMDKLFSDKLKMAGYTDLIPDKKIFQLSNETEYIIGDINICDKRPFVNRNINTGPNFHLISTSTQTKNQDLTFIQKVAHDDERYRRIDELFVPPSEYEEILEILKEKSIVFIIGDPGIGKTYTAVKILKYYFESGWEPIWFAGLEKEEREKQSRILSKFEPSENQIIYFEDPFGRTVFERRDSLFQVFSPLLDKLSNLNCKIIVSSRKEIFEKFSKESLLENDILKLKKELNIRKPSYETDGLQKIFDKYAAIICDWYENNVYRELVYSAICDNKITTPLAITDLIFVSRSVKSKSILKEHIERRGNESVKVFALEILSSSLTIKTVLYLIYFCGNKGKPFLSELFFNVANELNRLNLTIDSFSFNIEIRSQIGYRVEQLGFIKTAYQFSHPIYEESLSSLMMSDPKCEIIAKNIIQELAKKDVKMAYLAINRYVIKHPYISLLLYKHLLEHNSEIEDISLKQVICRKLISTFYNTKNEEFFELACNVYSLDELIEDINKGFINWKDTSQKLNLCQSYKMNSPKHFSSSLMEKIDWDELFSNRSDPYFGHLVMHILTMCASIYPDSVTKYIEKNGTSLIKSRYFYLDYSGRERLFNLVKGQTVEKDLIRYNTAITKAEENGNVNNYRLLMKSIFSEYKFFGKLVIDKGARTAIKTRWKSLLPVGIINVIGVFSASTIVGVYCNNEFVGVGVTEYSSEELLKLKGHSSNCLTSEHLGQISSKS